MESPAGLYQKAKAFLFEELWRADLPRQALWRRILYRSIRLFFVLGRELATGQLNLRAMSLVYTTLLSLVPLLAVSFSVLKAFGVHNQIEPLLYNLVAPLGEQGHEIVANILGFVDNMRVGVLGAVGLGLLIYTVISLIQKIEQTFNYVWQSKGSRSFARRFSDYLSVIMVGPVLVFAALGATASMMNSTLVQSIIAIEPFGSLIIFFTKLIPFLLIIAAFTFVYMFVPNTRVKFKAALVGALVGGALWQISGIAFAGFAAGSTKYAAIYSGFAILVLFMIWLYLSWLILLLGAQVAFFTQHPEQIRLGNRRIPLSGRFQEELALMVLYRIAEHFVHGSTVPALDDLTEALDVPGERIAEALCTLQDRGLLLETTAEPPLYVLAHDPATMSLHGILDILRRPDEEQAILEQRLCMNEQVSAVFRTLDSSIDAALNGLSLRDLVLQGKDGEK
ncbi:MAG: YihY/virulence factor BrkB family protein [Thiohalomonadaceae bacterium]